MNRLLNHITHIKLIIKILSTILITSHSLLLVKNILKSVSVTNALDGPQTYNSKSI